MFYAAMLSAIGSALMSLALSFATKGKLKEVSDAGYPCMRFASAHFLMLACGIAFSGFGIYEWLDPRNHQYSGNLAIMSYAPIVLGILAFFAAAYFASYLAVLTPKAIQVSSWPLGASEYPLDRLISLQEKGQQVILTFSDGRKLAVTYMLSGSRHFIHSLMTQRAA